MRGSALAVWGDGPTAVAKAMPRALPVIFSHSQLGGTLHGGNRMIALAKVLAMSTLLAVATFVSANVVSMLPALADEPSGEDVRSCDVCVGFVRSPSGEVGSPSAEAVCTQGANPCNAPRVLVHVPSHYPSRFCMVCVRFVRSPSGRVTCVQWANRCIAPKRVTSLSSTLDTIGRVARSPEDVEISTLIVRTELTNN